MLQLADGFGLDLPDALASDLENAADLFERVSVAVLQAVPQADDLSLAPGERLQQMVDLLPQDALIGTVHRIVAGLVLEKLAKARILAVTDGPIEADRMAANIQHATDFLDRKAGQLGDLFGRALAAILLQ